MRKILDFLLELTENNSKEWMDENRSYYLEVRKQWLDHVQQMLDRLSAYEPSYSTLDPKKTIFRINNNRVFHPDKPVYKDNFAFDPSAKGDPSFYVHISPFSAFIGGGFYHPPTDALKKLRAAIDYDGEKLKAIVNSNSFQESLGWLTQDDQMLKTSPRGYSRNHRHIDLLNRKSFTAIRTLTHTEILSSDFHDIVEKTFVEMIPFRGYLKKAMDF